MWRKNGSVKKVVIKNADGKIISENKYKYNYDKQGNVTKKYHYD